MDLSHWVLERGSHYSLKGQESIGDVSHEVQHSGHARVTGAPVSLHPWVFSPSTRKWCLAESPFGCDMVRFTDWTVKLDLIWQMVESLSPGPTAAYPKPWVSPVLDSASPCDHAFCTKTISDPPPPVLFLSPS